MAEDSDDPLVGRTLEGRFTLLRRLGEGGMGAVYLARQHSVDREVAIKLIGVHAAERAHANARFLREAKLTARLSHPNVVGVLDHGETPDGLAWLAMERVRGRPLDAVLADDGPLPPARAVGVAAQICDALQAAHALDIVHRDLKPANVMLLAGDRVKVLDFGIARSLAGEHTTLTETGAIIGTPSYLSPEVALGRPAEAASDQYALGVMLYEMLTGEVPFQADSAVALLHQHAYTPPPRVETAPPALARVVARALAKEPADRFPSVAVLREALADALTSPLAPPEPRGRLGLMLLLGGLVLTGLALWWLGGRDATSVTGPSDAARVVAQPPALPDAAAGSAAAPDAAPDVAAPVDAATSAPDGAPATVSITFEATPRATVQVDGEAIGQTPVRRDFPRSDVRRRARFSAPGHRAASRRFDAAGDRVVRVRLRPVPDAAPEPEEGFIRPR